jgi:hypothetical protein
MVIPAMAAKSMFLVVQTTAVAAEELALMAKTVLRSAIPALAACFALSYLPTVMAILTAAAKSTLQTIHTTAAPAVQSVQLTYQTAPPAASIHCAACNAWPALRIAMQLYLMVARRQSLLTFTTAAGAAKLCPPGINVVMSCPSSACAITCITGFANCNGNLNNCGACGNVCSSVIGSPSCTDGSCGIVCNTGFGNCNNNAIDECETNLVTDILNSGSLAKSASSPFA